MTGFWSWFHDAWEIVGAVASAGAVIVAVWLARHERIDRKQAEKERDEARAESAALAARAEQRERESQARRVALWHLDGAKVDSEVELRLRCANYSELPVFSVCLGVRKGGGLERFSRTLRATLGPGEDVGHWVPRPPIPELTSSLYAEFRDAAGLYWRRWADGRLEELPAPHESAEAQAAPSAIRDAP